MVINETEFGLYCLSDTILFVCHPTLCGFSFFFLPKTPASLFPFKNLSCLNLENTGNNLHLSSAVLWLRDVSFWNWFVAVGKTHGGEHCELSCSGNTPLFVAVCKLSPRSRAVLCPGANQTEGLLFFLMHKSFSSDAK